MIFCLKYNRNVFINFESSDSKHCTGLTHDLFGFVSYLQSGVMALPL